MKHFTKIYPSLFLLILMATSSCISVVENNRTINLPFSHHVFFWLNNPNDPADRAAFEQGLKDLLEIEEIKAYQVGVPADVAQRGVVDGSYTYSYLVFFENMEGHDIYQDHPVHQKFIDDYQHLWNKVVVYDAIVE